MGQHGLSTEVFGGEHRASDATTRAGSYTCALCKVTSTATVVGLTPASKLLRSEDVEMLRRTRAARESLQRRQGVLDASEDPEDIEATVLANQVRDLMRYATCPACNARNPSGAACSRKEEFTAAASVSGIFLLLAAGTYWLPWMGYAMPVLGILLTVMSVRVARRVDQPVRRGPLLFNAAVVAIVTAFVVALPRFAFFLPALYAAWVFFAPRSKGEDRYVKAAQQIRFVTNVYRDPTF